MLSVRRTPSFRIRLRRQRRVRPLIGELTGMQIPPEKVYGQCIGQQPADSLMVCYGGRRHTARRRTPPLRRPDPRHGHQCRAPRVPDQRPERRAELIFEEVAAGRLTTEPRSMIEATGDYAEQLHTGAGAQRIHRTASRRRHDLGRNLRRRADGGHLPRRWRDRLDPHWVDGLLAQRRRPRRSPDMRLPGDFPWLRTTSMMRPVVIPDSATITPVSTRGAPTHSSPSTAACTPSGRKRPSQ